MPHKIRRSIWRIGDTHIFLPLLLATWGAWMFAVNPIGTSSTFSRFEILPNTVWGLGTFLVGVISVHLVRYATKTTGRLRHKVYSVAGMILTSSGYFFILTMVVLGNWMSTATISYGGLLVLSLINLAEYIGLLYDE